MKAARHEKNTPKPETSEVVKQEQQSSVSILKFTADEESTTKVPFIMDLPLSVADIDSLISKHKQTSLILKRLRDYHHPDGTLTDKDDKVAKWQKYNKFVVAMIAYWLKTEKKSEEEKIFQAHL